MAYSDRPSGRRSADTTPGITKMPASEAAKKRAET
jgi:hypothetical protein